MYSRVRKLSERLLCDAKYVQLNGERAVEVAGLVKDFDLAVPYWNWEPLYPQSEDFEEICLYYLILNSINYCYFDKDCNKFQDGSVSGASLACIRLTESWEEIKDPHFLSNIDENYLLENLFQSDGPISLVKERTQALRELGEFANSTPDFTFEKLFKRYKQNAYLVSQVIPTLLPTWRDPFFKRAQLFMGMVYGRFQDREDLPIEKESLQDLTVFADYRVPQTLIAMGIIELGVELRNKIYQRVFLESGSRMELELRAGAIRGADLLTHELQKRVDVDVNSLHTDFLLWNATHIPMPEGVFDRPWSNHHYCMTTDY